MSNIANLSGGFSEVANSTISGNLFDDRDSDGVRDSGEYGLGGVSVELLDIMGRVVAVTKTDAQGNYEFDGLKAGDYRVRMPERAEGRALVEREASESSSVSGDTQTRTAVESVAKTADITSTLGIAHKPENLIVNGDFESNPSANAGYVNAAASAVAGWSSSTGTIQIQESNYGSGNAVGDGVAELNYVTKQLSQNVTIDEGGLFKFSLAYSSRVANSGDLQVVVDGVIVATAKPQLGKFQTLNIDLELTAGAHEIRLVDAGATSNSLGMTVDDISLTAIKEPTSLAANDSFDVVSGDVISGTSVPGSTIVVLDSAGEPVTHVVTSENGEYSLSGLKEGSYSVRFPDGSAADKLINAAAAADVDLQDVWSLVGQYEGRDADNVSFISQANVNLLSNGDFESNPINNAGYVNSGASAVAGWSSSTGYIHIQESNYGSGNQAGDALVELNYVTGDLYRFVDIAEDGSFKLSLMHSSRVGNGGDLEVLVDGKVVATALPMKGEFQQLDIDLDLPAGRHEIRFRGYEANAGEHAYGVTIDDIVLAPSEPIAVTDPTKPFAVEKGAEVAGAAAAGEVVVLEDADGKPVAHVITDDAGNYSFEGLAAGNYSLRIPTGGGADNLLKSVVENGGSLSAAYTAIENHTEADLKNSAVYVAKGANLIVNGEFEDNGFGEAGYAHQQTSKVTGWTTETGKLELHESNYGIGNTAGDAVAELGPVGYKLSQTVTVAESGNFTLSGVLGTRLGNGQDLTITVDGEVVGTFDAFTGKLNEFSVDLDLSKGSHTISFSAGVNSRVGIDNIELRENIVNVAIDDETIQLDGDTTDEISGVNLDVIPGSKVELIDEKGSVVAQTVTSTDGTYNFDGLENGNYNVRFSEDLGFDGGVDADGLNVRLGENQQISDVNAGFEGTVIEACENEIDVKDFDSKCGIVTEDVWFAHGMSNICARISWGVNENFNVNSFANAGTNTLPFYVHLDEPALTDMTIRVALTTDPNEVQPVGGKALAPDWFAYLTNQTSENGAQELEYLELTIKKGQTVSEPGYIGVNSAPVNYTFGVKVVDISGGTIDEGCSKPTIVATTPVAFDLNGDGIINVTGETTSEDKTGVENINATVEFDIDGDGTTEFIEWLDGSGDGMLVDNRDGLSLAALAADMDGNRLFGDQNGTYNNGYQKLAAQFDTNRDGVVSNQELEGLQIWRDDGDAKLEAGELLELSDFGIVSVNTRVTLEYDAEGRPLARSNAQTDYEATGQVSYSLEGADADLFSVDENGKVTFKEAPDYENPLDSDGDNVYELTLVRTFANGLDPDCAPEKEALRVEVCDKDDAQLASLGDYVWLDTDKDGVQDAGEQGVAGVNVTLTGAGADGDFGTSDDITETTTTDQNGQYLFGNLTPGDYYVTFDKPEGYEFTTTDGGAADTNGADSDANRTTGRTSVVTLTAGEFEPDVDAGLIVEEVEPASLGDYVWLDTDRDGVQDPNEQGVEGVTVTLTGAGDDGVIGTDDDTTTTTTTDEQGKYLFTDLTPGDYQVTFGKPDGYDFTITDGSASDTDGTDSDADPTTGKSTVVTLTAGEFEPDIDAGLVVRAAEPAASNDEGKVCATEAKNIDVLANDIAENDPLSITSVNGQAIAAGGSVTLASGAVVTLNADGTLGYNSVNGSYQVDGQSIASDELLIGQQAEDSFTYGVTDASGQTAMATVDMTVCGAKNTLDTIAASLPEGGIVNITLDSSSDGDFYTANISNTGDERFDGKAFDIAYCVAAEKPIGLNVDVPYKFYLASESDVPTGTVTFPQNLDMVNWILNQDFGSKDNGEGGTYTEAEIQGAIWGLTDEYLFVNETLYDYGTEENAQEILDLALANGEGFEAGEGDIVGLILDPTKEAEDQGNIQPFIIGINFDDLAQDCLCG